jgi:glycyl-tRNA synthetase (class II)
MFRVDKLIEEKTEKETSFMSEKDFLSTIKTEKINCPHCKGALKEEINNYNLMMKTEVGLKPFSLK